MVPVVVIVPPVSPFVPAIILVTVPTVGVVHSIVLAVELFVRTCPVVPAAFGSIKVRSLPTPAGAFKET